MQQNPQGPRFSQDQPQTFHRFPQNRQPVQGWQTQQTYPAYQYAPMEEPQLPPKEKKAVEKKHKKRRRRIFTLWNLFAVIGIITVFIQAARYVVIPLLIYLQTLTGGAA